MESEDMEKKESKNYVDEKGNVYILGDFDDTISTHVLPGVIDLISKFSALRDPPPITFYINSPGGFTKELYSLLTLINKAKAQGIKIVTVIIGYAYSCASMLAICGDYRVMWEYGEHLMHYGQAFTDPRTPVQHARETKRLQHHFKNIEELYHKHTKLKPSQIKEFMKDDSKFLTPEECLKYGLIDEIIKDIPLENKKGESTK